MAQEQLPSTFLEEFRALKREVAALRKATPLNNASLSGVATVLGDGRVESEDYEEGAAGWSLQRGIAEFNDIRLRGGIIGNEALANPVNVKGAGFSEVGTFTLTTTETIQCSSSIPIPEGFSQAIVMAVAAGMASNPNLDADYMTVRASINGSSGGGVTALAGGNGGWANATASAQRLVTGLAGGSIPVGTAMYTQAASWGTGLSNAAHIDAIAVFLR